jgi:hypothetical protein
MKGFDALVDWIPRQWIVVLDPGARVADGQLREALAVAAVCLIAMIAMRICHSLVRGAGGLFSARRHHLRPSGGFAMLRWLAGAAFVLTPLARVVMLIREGTENADQAHMLTVVSGILWAVLTAADHRGAWLEGKQPVLVVRRGFAPFRVQTVRVPLVLGLRDAATRRPIGEIGAGRRQVRLHPDVTRHLNAAVGNDNGLTWLRPLLLRDGVVLLAGESDEPKA